jgi:hypothetical protein
MIILLKMVVAIRPMIEKKIRAAKLLLSRINVPPCTIGKYSLVY